MNTSLLLCCFAMTAVVAGCANEGQQSYERIQQAEKVWGPASNWTPQQSELFRQTEAVAHAQEAQQAAQAAAVGQALSQGLQQAGAQIAGAQTDPSIVYRMNNRSNANSLANPYGAGSPYKPDGLMNPYSQYGSSYSNKSWRNPYATDAPRLYDQQGNYLGELSANPYDRDSTSNPYGRYDSKYSPDSINNPYGAGNPYSTQPINVVPSR